MTSIFAINGVAFLNKLTGGNLLAWKVFLTSAVFALAGSQLALAARFWGLGGLPIKPDTAAKIHRWSGRVLLIGAVAVGLACLVGPAGVTSPTRVLLHSLFGTLLFVALVVKFALLKLTKKFQNLLPASGILLFFSFLAVWATSVADYVSAR